LKTPTYTPLPSPTPCPGVNGYFFVAHLDGRQRVPPNNSPGTGDGTFLLDASGTMHFHVTYQNLLAAETAAHLHQAPPGVNGPVILPLPMGSPKDGSASWNPMNTAALLAGNVYVNIHTTMFPGGEIRGQLVRRCPTPTP
jgi:hypothetical protein